MTGPGRTPRLVWDDADVGVDATGAVSLSRAGQDYLVGFGPTRLALHGADRRDLTLGPPTIEALPDEINLRWVIDLAEGELTMDVRHSFGLVWGQRWVLRNRSARPVDVGELVVPLVPVADAVQWLFAGGVESSLSVQPFDPEIPVLGLVLQQGELRRHAGAGEGADGIDLGQRGLGPHESYVADVRGEFFSSPAAFARTVHRWLPPTTYVERDEIVVIDHPDAAVTRNDLCCADGAVVSSFSAEWDGDQDSHPLNDASDLDAGDLEEGIGDPSTASEFAAPPGAQRCLEFHDARGRTELVLHWAPSLADAIADRSRAILAGPRAGNGAVRLPDAAAGLLLQRAVAERAEIDIDDASDALDRLAAQPIARDRTDAWHVLFDCGEFQRTGDPDLLERAVRTFTTSRPCPGLGLAATRLVVALLAAGRDPGPVMRHLVSCRDDAEDAETALELALVAGAVFGGGQHPDIVPGERWLDTVQEVAVVATRLGSGLLGRATLAVDAGTRARWVLLMSLMPELAAPWHSRLAHPPAMVARYAGQRVLWDLDHGPVPPRRTGLDGGLVTPRGALPPAAHRLALVWLSLAADTDV